MMGKLIFKKNYQATHWNYGSQFERVRSKSNPPITEDFWANQFNRKLNQEFQVKREKKSGFIHA